MVRKADFNAAFHLFPISPFDLILLGFTLDDQFFINSTMVLGACSSCRIFETFVTAMEWAIKKRSQLDSITHYLHDFFLAHAMFTGCKELMGQFEDLTEFVGAPLSPKKTEGPTTCLTFLGMQLDTVNQTISIPNIKCQEAVELIMEALNAEKGKAIVSYICGKLQFVVKGLSAGWVFLRRLYNMQKLVLPISKRYSVYRPNPKHHLKLSQGTCKDLNMWLTFLPEDDYDKDQAVPFLHLLKGLHSLELYTDSAGLAKLGFGCTLRGQWAFGRWSLAFFKHRKPSITFLEFLTVVLAVDTWAEEMSSSQILVMLDNQSVIQFINKVTSKCKWCMSLVRHLTLTCMHFQIHLVGVYFPTFTVTK